LTYGGFTYADLTVDPPAIPPDGVVTVSVEVTNTSDREAPEVVQLYLHQRHGRASRPVRELKGFERVVVAAGTSRRVRFTLGPEHRRYWSSTERDWVLDSTTFDIWVGGSSTADTTTTFEVNPT